MCSDSQEIRSLMAESRREGVPTLEEQDALPAHLKGDCGKDICFTCPEPVKQSRSGKWYITMGHPGFNSRANNGSGYASKERAVAAYLYYRKAGA